MGTKEKILDFIKKDDKINFYILLGACILGTIFIIFKVQTSQRILITQSVAAIMLGLVFESLRLSKNAKHTFKELLLGYLFSFIVFIPLSSTGFDIEKRIATWPAIFIMSYTLTTMFVFKDQVVAKANITTTAVLSLAAIYWSIENNFFNDDYLPFIAIAVLSVLAAAFTFFFALNSKPLTQRKRILLSSWTALIMIVLAIDFALGIYLDTKYLTLNTWREKIYDFGQYFVLGMALVYILQNIYLLYEFVSPEKSPNDQHVHRIIQTHLKRYPSQKPKNWYLLMLTICISAFFVLNHQFKLISPYTAIWLVFIVYTSVESQLKLGSTHRNNLSSS